MTDEQLIAAFPGIDTYEFLLKDCVGLLKRSIWRGTHSFGFASSDRGDVYVSLHTVREWQSNEDGLPHQAQSPSDKLTVGTPLTFGVVEGPKGLRAVNAIRWSHDTLPQVWRPWRLCAWDSTEKLIATPDIQVLWEGRNLYDLRKKFPSNLPQSLRSQSSAWPHLKPRTIHVYPLCDHGSRALYFERMSDAGVWEETSADPRYFDHTGGLGGGARQGQPPAARSSGHNRGATGVRKGAASGSPAGSA